MTDGPATPPGPVGICPSGPGTTEAPAGAGSAERLARVSIGSVGLIVRVGSSVGLKVMVGRVSVGFKVSVGLMLNVGLETMVGIVIVGNVMVGVKVKVGVLSVGDATSTAGTAHQRTLADPLKSDPEVPETTIWKLPAGAALFGTGT
jgi:hypothetical protein